MSDYSNYQNLRPSRDTQADIDRLPEHFARLAKAEDRKEFAAYCKRVNLIIAPVASGWEHAFEAWEKDRANEIRREKERLMGGVL